MKPADKSSLESGNRSRRRIYLDHAATRFPKPAIVLQTMHDFSQYDEAAVGRGAYRASQDAGEIVARLRGELARWIDADSAEEISFHAGGTSAINAGLFGVLRDGDHVVTTAAEHNSVLRPLHHLSQQQRITWNVVPVDQSGCVRVEDILSAVTHRTRMVAVMHAANVTGAVQPIDVIGNGLRDRFAATAKPILFCDAAQTFGHLPLSVRDAAIDVLAAPGHKGGCGPLGTGFLYVNKTLHPTVRPSLFGGTGSQSESLDMPHSYPNSFESGNVNVPALAGWLAGLRERRGNDLPQGELDRSANAMRRLAVELYERLDQCPGIEIIGRVEDQQLQLPIASVRVAGYQASDAAMILDSEFGIEVRSGLHCAAMVHEAIGSPPDGTLRISCGETTTLEELDVLAEALRQLE